MNRQTFLGSMRAWTCWLILSEAVVLTVPTWVGYGVPVWDAERIGLTLGLAAVQLVSTLIIAGSAIRDRMLPPRWVAPLVGGLLGTLYLALLLLNVTRYSRAVLLVGSTLVFVLSLLPSLWTKSRSRTVLLGLTLLAGAVSAHLLGGPSGIERGLEALKKTSQPEVDHSILPSTYHTVEAKPFNDILPRDEVDGGAIATLRDGYLLVNGSGRFFYLRLEAGGDSLQVRRLGLRVPLNWEAFDSATGQEVNSRWFRTADLLAETQGDSVSLLVSHHRWKPQKRCYVVRLSRFETDLAELYRADGFDDADRWETLYETEPCLPLKNRGRNRFAGLQAGGRLARLDEATFLLTVGDHEYDGWNSEVALPRQSSADYGKILVLESEGERESSVFSTGHRNPQGLHIDSAGRIWSTEHGPEGGDELNLVRKGSDFGWPYQTLGTEYGMHRWPLVDTVGCDFRRPFFAWTPSIGVSNLIAVRDTIFKRWQGDLLVASLKENALFRMRIRDDRVLNVEKIEIGGRIRDLVEGPEGRIALFLDDESVVFLAPARMSDDGAVVFAAECSGCHTTGETAEGSMGPSLQGVFGRQIAGREDYEYSESLESVDGAWTEQNLDSFLADPEEFAPGTTMRWDGITDPDRRRSVITYLEDL